MTARIDAVQVAVDGARVVVTTTSSHGRESRVELDPIEARRLGGALADAAEHAGRNRLRTAA